MNCSTPETANVEAENRLADLLEVKNVKNTAKKFISRSLLDDLKCLSDYDAELYWMEKKSVASALTSFHKQVQVYHKVSSQVLDRIQSEDNPIIADKTSSPASSPFIAESLPENIWSLWGDFLKLILTEDHDDKDIHECSLEYLGIITVGDHIGNKQSRELYPKYLLQQTNKFLKPPSVDAFWKFCSFYSPPFDAIAVSLDECDTLLLKNGLKVKKNQ